MTFKKTVMSIVKDLQDLPTDEKNLFKPIKRKSITRNGLKVISGGADKFTPQDPNTIEIPPKKKLPLDNPPSDFIYEKSPPMYILKPTEKIYKSDEWFTNGCWIQTSLNGVTGTKGYSYRRSVYKKNKKWPQYIYSDYCC